MFSKPLLPTKSRRSKFYDFITIGLLYFLTTMVDYKSYYNAYTYTSFLETIWHKHRNCKDKPKPNIIPTINGDIYLIIFMTI